MKNGENKFKYMLYCMLRLFSNLVKSAYNLEPKRHIVSCQCYLLKANMYDIVVNDDQIRVRNDELW